jgi:hypothetical protein
VETEAVGEQITGGMLRDRVEKFVVCLQQVYEIEKSHTEHVFTHEGHMHANSS